MHRRPPLSAAAPPSHPRRHPLAAPGPVRALLVWSGAAVLAACSGSGAPVPTAAPRAGSPACAAALDRLPATVLGRSRSALPVTGAAGWGDPQIVLRCGLPAPGPTTRDCLTVDGVDWVVDQGSDPVVFTTFGRAPAVELRVPLSYGRENAAAALVDVAPVGAALPRTQLACVSS